MRLAYVAATRARDLLVVPAVGDAPHDKGWVQPLSAAIYAGDDDDGPGRARRSAAATRSSTGRHNNVPTLHTMRPGAYAHTDPVTGGAYTVVWWDPLPPRSRRAPSAADCGTST